MAPVLFTSSSKIFRYLIIIFITSISFFIFDNLLFHSLFKQYDKMYEIKKNFVSTDILVIGSSHVLWDIDVNLIELKTGKSTKMISIPGADMELRREIIEEFTRKKISPKYLILETDKFSFSDNRYPKNAYLQLQGYYHFGLFQTLIESKRGDDFDFKFARVVKSHSLNSYSHFILSKLYDKYFPGPVKAYAIETKEIIKPIDTRIEIWRKDYPSNLPEISNNLVLEFNKTLSLAASHNMEVILVETPSYYFNDFENDSFNEIRNVIISAGKLVNAKFIRFPHIEKNSELFFDASHLLPKGKQMLTEELIQVIGKE